MHCTEPQQHFLIGRVNRIIRQWKILKVILAQNESFFGQSLGALLTQTLLSHPINLQYNVLIT